MNSSTLPANQNLDLWTDTTAQKVFVNHWKFFAQRYQVISPTVLSFNLVNEPKDIAEEDYVNLMKMAIDAIHEISPNRIIFVDGLNYARNIVLSLKDEPNSDKDFSVSLNNAASQLSFENTLGDRMTLNSISLVIDSDSVSYVLSDNSWGKKQSTYLIDENYTLKTQEGTDLFSFEDYKTSFTLAEENNIPYMVQEFCTF